MEGDPTHNRWLCLLDSAEILASLAREDSTASRESILLRAEAQLTDVTEIFGSEIDPVSDLEGYAVRRLTRALLTLVQSMSAPLPNSKKPVLGSKESLEWKLMKMLKLPKTIYITATDKERLERIIASSESSPNLEMLEEELARATIVDSRDIPSDVVTMNSRVLFKDLDTGEELEFTLVYPWEADLERAKISILAPVGAALLGLRVGDEIDWPLPSGKIRSLRILNMLFQPEASGQFHL